MHISTYIHDTCHHMSIVAASAQRGPVIFRSLTPESSSTEQNRSLQHSSQFDRGQHLSIFVQVRPAIHATEDCWLKADAKLL